MMKRGRHKLEKMQQAAAYGLENGKIEWLGNQGRKTWVWGCRRQARSEWRSCAHADGVWWGLDFRRSSSGSLDVALSAQGAARGWRLTGQPVQQRRLPRRWGRWRLLRRLLRLLRLLLLLLRGRLAAAWRAHLLVWLLAWKGRPRGARC